MVSDPDISWDIDREQPRSIGLSLMVVLSMIAFSALAVSSGATAVSTAATTITVDESGGADHTSIQAAVNNATTGDTIEVQSGTYNETVTVSKDVTIIAPQGATLDRGTNPDRVFPLNPDRSNSAFVIEQQAAPTIEGFTIQNYRGTAIYAFRTTTDWTARDLTIQNVSIGVGTSRSEGNWLIESTEMIDTTAPLYADDTTGAFTIRDTTVQSSATGLSTLRASGDWSMTNLTITDINGTALTAVNTSGTWSIQESTITNVETGLNATDSSYTGDATQNWWGACDGPSGDFAGSGVSVTGNVAVDPHYTDAAQTTLSSDASSACQSSGDFDFGVELQQSATVTQGNDVTISVNPNNNADTSISETTVELLVDANDDGQFESDEIVASTTADFAAGEYRTFDLTYSNVQLAPGEYSYMGRISKNGQTSRSFTNGTLNVTSGSGTSTTLALSGSVQQSGSPGEQAIVEYTITNSSDQNSVTLNLTGTPSQLSVNQSASQFGGATFTDGTALYISPSGTQTATVVFDISANAGSTQTFTIDAAVEDENGTVSDTVQTQVGDVQQTPTEQYDTNNNGRIDLNEVRTAINDFASGDLGLQVVRTLINQWANGAPT